MSLAMAGKQGQGARSLGIWVLIIDMEQKK